MSDTLVPVLDGLAFAEGPRWRDGRLWFSDMYAHTVLALDPGTGRTEVIAEVPARPSGLGWRPDGTLLVVSMTDRRLLAVAGDGLREVADLSDVAPHDCNDMVVDAAGRAYIGNFGFDRHQGQEPRTTTLVLVDPDGRAEVADDDLFFPNGSVITDDGRTLVVGESWGRRLTAWTRDERGRLSDRRIWADLGDNVPDGICLDREGAIWVADPRNNEAFRVHEGGQITDRISTGERGSYACVLGGEDGRTLFLCTNVTSGRKAAQERGGRIEAIEVAVPSGGSP